MNRHNVSISEAMTVQLVTFRETDPIENVISAFLKKHISGAPVVDDSGRLIGMISEKDCMRVYVDGLYNRMPAGSVSDYMVSPVKTMSPTESILDAAKLFFDTHYRRFPVVDSGNRLVGQISRCDVLRAMEEFSLTGKSEPAAKHP